MQQCWGAAVLATNDFCAALDAEGHVRAVRFSLYTWWDALQVVYVVFLCVLRR